MAGSKGHTLPYRLFSKDQRVIHTAVVENKRLSHALRIIKALALEQGRNAAKARAGVKSLPPARLILLGSNSAIHSFGIESAGGATACINNIENLRGRARDTQCIVIYGVRGIRSRRHIE